MPIKGVIAVFIAALIIAVVCFEGVREDFLEWIEDDNEE